MNNRNLLYGFLFISLWFLFVLYPNPIKLTQSIYRIFNYSTCSVSVEEITKEVSGKNPKEIESYILNQIKYDYDWNVYGYPWYFPKAEEVIKNQKGDCKSRFIVIASVFDYLQIPYELSMSLTHIWIDYQEKEETVIENNKVRLYSQSKGLEFPEIDWQESKKTFIQAFWDCMPQSKKTLLLTGPLFFMALINITKRR